MSQVRPEASSLGVTDILVSSPMVFSNDFRERLKILKTSPNYIKIENVGKRFGDKMTTREELSKCLKNFAAQTKNLYYCDGKGP